MTFLFKKARISYRKKKRSPEGKAVLARLRTFLDKDQKQPVQTLCGFWKDQQTAITYQELRQAVIEGFMDEKYYTQWSNDYSHLVVTQFEPLWTGAIEAGSTAQPILDEVHASFSFNLNTPGTIEWIHNRGSELVTRSSEIQKEAINYFLDEKIRENYEPAQLARLIRPCIGLTEGQTVAAKKLYDRTLEEQRKQHPRTKDSVLQQRAMDKTLKYAERAHRQRAATIVQTELAKAYNFGADQTIRIAQENYLIGKCIKRWNTAGDDNVCSHCADLDGTEVGMEERFYDGTKIEEDGMYPPLHPRCACAIQYIEVEPPDLGRVESEESKPSIENEDAVVDYEVVDSNEYSKKFMSLEEDKNTTRSIRNTAREFLNHRNGSLKEDLAFIDSSNGKVLKNKSGMTDKSCNPTKNMMKALLNSDNYTMIALHNHPESLPPSVADIMAAVERKYKYGIVACHDGTVYKYTITEEGLSTKDMNMPILVTALKKARIEKVEADIAGVALTNVSTMTYNMLMETFVRLEVL